MDGDDGCRSWPARDSMSRIWARTWALRGSGLGLDPPTRLCHLERFPARASFRSDRGLPVMAPLPCACTQVDVDEYRRLCDEQTRLSAELQETRQRLQALEAPFACRRDGLGTSGGAGAIDDPTIGGAETHAHTHTHLPMAGALLPPSLPHTHGGAQPQWRVLNGGRLVRCSALHVPGGAA